MRKLLLISMMIAGIAGADTRMNAGEGGVHFYSGFWPVGGDATNVTHSLSVVLAISSDGITLNTNTFWIDNVPYSGGETSVLESVTVSGSSPISDDSLTQYTLTGHYSLGPDQNKTQSAAWSADATNCSITASGGMLTVANMGSWTQTVDVVASYGGFTNTLEVTINGVNSAPVYAETTFGHWYDLIYEGVYFNSEDLYNNYVYDPDGDAMTAYKISGDSGVYVTNIAPNSIFVRGIPDPTDAVVTNDFVLYFSDSFVNTTGTVKLIVQPEPVAESGALYPVYPTNDVPAVTAPGDPFTPPVSTNTYSGAPAISEWGRQAERGDTIPLTSEDLL